MIQDNVNHPVHYNTCNPRIFIEYNSVANSTTDVEHKWIDIECIEVIRNMPLWKGNALKYLWRCGLKKDASMTDTEKEIEDLRKAVWYINDRIEYLQNENKNKKS